MVRSTTKLHAQITTHTKGERRTATLAKPLPVVHIIIIIIIDHPPFVALSPTQAEVF
jgi:hypothetical protein